MPVGLREYRRWLKVMLSERKGAIVLTGDRAFLCLLVSSTRRNQMSAPNIIKSKRAKQRILAMMREYEETHTHEEGVRMWERLVELLKAI